MLAVIYLLMACLAMSCGNDDEPNVQEQKVNLLTADTWVIDQVVSKSDGNLTEQYKDFAIAFLKKEASEFEGDYFIVDGGHAFQQATGKWRFSDDLTKLVLSDGKEIEFSLTAESLTLEFHVVPPNGRVGGLGGDFKFILKHRN